MANSKFVQDVLKFNGIARKHWASHLNQDVQEIKFPQIPEETEIQDYFEKLKSSNQVIMLFSDSDADGTTGLAIMRKWMKRAGFLNHPICLTRDVGYGLNTQIIQEYKDKHDIKLLITMDCGISNRKEIEFAASLGVETIITDHHAPPMDHFDIPRAKFILHPEIMKVKELEHFSGSGMAYFLLQILEKRFQTGMDLAKELLPIATLGTVGDMTKLQGLNRDFVKLGIRNSQMTNIPGFEALKRVGKIDSVNEEDMAFGIIPRLNAAGRMRDPMLSFAVLATDCELGAQKAAETLDKLNQKRKSLCAEYLGVLLGAVDESKPVIAVAGDFLGGIIGISAANLVEIYNKPAFVMSTQGDTLRGSARAPGFFSVINALRHCAPALLKYGGHPQAGGFSLKHENLALFEQLLIESYEIQIQQEAPDRVYLDWKPEYAESLISDIALLRPLGQGFLCPTFKSRTVLENPKPNRDYKHLFAKVHGFKATGWNMYDDRFTDGAERDIIFTVSTSSYGRKKPYVQLNIKRIEDIA